MKCVTEYIQANWRHTIHTPDERCRGMVRMPTNYSVPCASRKDRYADFYYWDTYFANLGLLLDGEMQQVENNLDVMAYFIRNLGYVPNANHGLDRSQPPLFTRGVWDLYHATDEKRILEKYIHEILREYAFFQYDRNTPIGLNQFSSQRTRSNALAAYPIFSKRVGEYRDTEEERIEFVKDMMAIAESGWDFTPRFDTEERRFAAREYVHLDLNCLLFDVETKIADMLGILGDMEQAAIYCEYARVRKEKMEVCMQDKESGIFYDYNFHKNCFSSVTSCASFYPYAVGLSDDKVAAKKVLEKLELEYGLTACEYRGDEADYLQWDYPCMWPSNVYFAYVGLKRIGLTNDAERVAKKFIHTVKQNFEQSGRLWEKYDAKKGVVAVTKEYETTEMMGWTAGVYRFLEEQDCL